MQTFLPYPDFIDSAKVLDNKRLGKQRVECLQILRASADPTYGWQNHPAVKMWRGHGRWLHHHYMAAIVSEWLRRGYKDTCYEKARFLTNDWDSLSAPHWIGRADFHASHRSNLLRKDPVYYSQFGWTEPNNLPYIWPI